MKFIIPSPSSRPACPAQPKVKTEAKSRIKACSGPDPGCGINFEPRFDRFDRFDKLTAGKLAAGRLTVLAVLSAAEGSEVEGGSSGLDKLWIPGQAWNDASGTFYDFINLEP